jgi:hypothetical protein
MFDKECLMEYRTYSEICWSAGIWPAPPRFRCGRRPHGDHLREPVGVDRFAGRERGDARRYGRELVEIAR